MSKSIKRNNKYYGDDLYESYTDHEEHRAHIKEKHLRAALKSKNITALCDLTEEE
jgi:quinol monooxygenase YgiN